MLDMLNDSKPCVCSTYIIMNKSYFSTKPEKSKNNFHARKHTSNKKCMK